MRRVFLFLFFVFPFVVERRGGLNAFTSCSGGAGSCIISCSLARRRYSSASQLKPSLCLLTRRARITLTVLPKHTDVTNPSPRDQFIDFLCFFWIFFDGLRDLADHVTCGVGTSGFPPELPVVQIECGRGSWAERRTTTRRVCCLKYSCQQKSWAFGPG